jgi:hypothetical protein
MGSRAATNRVTPFGEIIATEARGLLFGNRGVLHDGRREARPHLAGSPMDRMPAGVQGSPPAADAPWTLHGVVLPGRGHSTGRRAPAVRRMPPRRLRPVSTVVDGCASRRLASSGRHRPGDAQGTDRGGRWQTHPPGQAGRAARRDHDRRSRPSLAGAGRSPIALVSSGVRPSPGGARVSDGHGAHSSLHDRDHPCRLPTGDPSERPGPLNQPDRGDP